MPLLAKALHSAGVEAEEWTESSEAELLVVADPAWETLPETLPARVLLVSDESTVMAGWAEQLAQRGYFRDFGWRSKGRAQPSALFCTSQPTQLKMVRGYEMEMDILRDRMVRAERTCGEEAELIARLRTDLSLSRSHEQQLEKDARRGDRLEVLEDDLAHALCRQQEPPALAHSAPLRVPARTAQRRHRGCAGTGPRPPRVRRPLFPGKVMRADRFAPVELLVRQVDDQPAGPKISIVVPLYNTPLDFLEELLDSVVNQTYRNWELCCVDAGTAPGVGEMVQQRAAVDPRIRYRKLEKNELIPGNTNKGIEMATGDFIALLDHDDILHPCAPSGTRPRPSPSREPTSSIPMRRPLRARWRMWCSTTSSLISCWTTSAPTTISAT